MSKGLASYCKAETTFTFYFSILTMSNAFLGIDNREMKSESGFSFAITSQPLWIAAKILNQNEIVSIGKNAIRWSKKIGKNMRASSTNLEATSDVTEVGYVLELNSKSVINEGVDKMTRAHIASSVAKVASKMLWN